jgi:DNA invertase Pin-like site-specific DNA recombinase
VPLRGIVPLRGSVPRCSTTRRRFDVAMVCARDRLGRSLADPIDTLRVLEAAKVDLYLDQQAIDTTTPPVREDCVPA